MTKQAEKCRKSHLKLSFNEVSDDQKGRKV